MSKSHTEFFTHLNNIIVELGTEAKSADAGNKQAGKRFRKLTFDLERVAKQARVYSNDKLPLRSKD